PSWPKIISLRPLEESEEHQQKAEYKCSRQYRDSLTEAQLGNDERCPRPRSVEHCAEADLRQEIRILNHVHDLLDL
ncbi:hypothetical protein, partial [Enterobacter hormaechei]|uniref:hypothetical protein n=1 Tax=Enterobacter hormaechei TaxID=158836 RepID=UPI00203F77EC